MNEKIESAGFINDNYWMNNGISIERKSKNLIKFEQDGPYDFQLVMGKRKYIVCNYKSKEKKWKEEEITGLEVRRADFSRLKKYFQEKIITAYLENFNPEQSKSVDQIYQNVLKTSKSIRTEIPEYRLDLSYLIRARALNKPLEAYKSKLPQVEAAHILRDLGINVEPGTYIQLISLKDNHVVPVEIFDFDFEIIKKVLIKHAVCTLSFMIGDISRKEDLFKLIDIKSYIQELYGPGRIFDRMVLSPMKNQMSTSSDVNLQVYLNAY